jgi:arylformamidase
MKIRIENNDVDLSQGKDLSIAVGDAQRFVKAWYVEDPKITPVQSDDFIGSVEKGAPVNFRNIYFNPHGHGTHTETVGHISKEIHSINRLRIPLFIKAKLISVSPLAEDVLEGNPIIKINQFESTLNESNQGFEAIIIRTLPNDDKLNRDYSSSNPPFLERALAVKLREIGVKHLLIDLPSVDKEQDNGELQFHHAFWNYPEETDLSRTITEFIYVENEIQDGDYWLSLQVAPFENDASPSRPIIYPR